MITGAAHQIKSKRSVLPGQVRSTILQMLRAGENPYRIGMVAIPEPFSDLLFWQPDVSSQSRSGVEEDVASGEMEIRRIPPPR